MNRSPAKIVGTLYILGFVVGIAGSLLSAPGTLDTFPSRSTFIALGALLWILAAFGDVAHGILMYPQLKRFEERVALGYFGARLAEAGIILVSALLILIQIPLGELALRESSTNFVVLDKMQYQLISALCIQAQEFAYQIGMIALGCAGLLFVFGSAKTQILSRFWLIWGTIGYVLFLIGSIFEVLGANLMLLHTIPGGLWEISIGIWLIFKGFRNSNTTQQEGQ